MAISLGKKFEEVFRQDIKRLGWWLYRLPDQVSGYSYTSKNPCDFIVYSHPNLHLIECKSVHGNTFPFSNLSQYDLMKSYMNYTGVYPATVIWFIDHDKVIYVPIKTLVKMRESDKLKSVNVKQIDRYDISVVPSVKKRVFMTSDYSFLKGDIG